MPVSRFQIRRTGAADTQFDGAISIGPFVFDRKNRYERSLRLCVYRDANRKEPLRIVAAFEFSTTALLESSVYDWARFASYAEAATWIEEKWNRVALAAAPDETPAGVDAIRRHLVDRLRTAAAWIRSAAKTLPGED